MYCVIIGDIIKSSELSFAERDIAQRRLESTLETINKRFSVHLAANFRITLGDEVQGLLNDSACSLKIITLFTNEMYPYQIRFGVGIGEMRTTRIDPADPRITDGVAYNFARQAIIELEEKERAAFKKTPAPLFHVRFKTGSVDSDLMNLSCQNLQGITAGWTDRQWATINAVIAADNNQSEAAKSLGLAKSTITRNLQSARYSEYQETLLVIEDYLRETYDLNITSSTRLQQALNLIDSAKYSMESQIDYDLALARYQEALEIRKAVLKSPDELIAESYDLVGKAYLKQGHAQLALESFNKAWEMRVSLEADECLLADRYNSIGEALEALGRYQESLEWYEKALAIREEVLGNRHPDTATTYNNMAGVYDAQGDYDKALEWYEKALAIDEEVLGKGHPYTATTYNNMALVYYDQGDYDKALEWHARALAIDEEVLGKGHPSTATDYNNMAVVYRAQGEYDKALEWYSKALTIREEVLGKGHPYTIQTARAMGMIYVRQKNYPKALEYLEKSFGSQEEARRFLDQIMPRHKGSAKQ